MFITLCYVTVRVLFVVCRAVTESINQLITACAVSVAPGHKDCDAAIRQIQVNAVCVCVRVCVSDSI